MRAFLLLIAIVITGAIFGQTSISGRLVDNRGRAVRGASISIKDSYDGATSDSLGNYRFQTSEKGTQTLQVTSIGYQALERTINIEGQALHLDLHLREAPDELKAVIVTAGSFEAADSKRTTVLNSIDIVTTASANGDVTGAIRTLPGTQQIGEKEGLFVRGGSGEEARVFIDGTLVNNFFYSSVPDIAQRGRFSPFLFKGTIFSSGGYSALYGQALSGALILESIDMPDRSAANLGISSVGLSGGYQHLNAAKTFSWGGNYAYTNLVPYFELFKQRVDYFKVPDFHYADANFRLKTSKTGMLKFYGTVQTNRLGLKTPDIDSASLQNAFSLSNYNIYGNLSWREKLGNDWRLYIGSSFSTNKDLIENMLQDENGEKVTIPSMPYIIKSYNGDIRGSLAQVKSVLERKLGALSAIRAGGEYLYFRDDLRFNDTIAKNTIVDDHFKAAFAEADIYLSNNLAAKLGTRLEHSSLLNRANIVPRVSLAYKLGDKSQASFAYGIFYQKPERNQLIINNNLDYTKATHYILNFQRLQPTTTFRVEAFYKKYDDLVKLSPGINNNGNGYAKGVEFFWRDKKTFKGVDYWLSYSFLDTKRDYLNYPHSLQPNFAANHTASLVVKKFIQKWKTQVNGSYSFATGRPYYNIRYNGNESKYQLYDEGETISYNNLGVSLNYLPSIGKPNARIFTVWVLSVTNVLNQTQIYNYNYSYNGAIKQPVRPPANQFFFLGCFISFGTDRTEDIINSNL
ncbi:TonB-dependent receptor [Flavihumibacter solisilvae]|uniref:TonB-dependent receptor n=1 Tax=Flavihumibacter solisilvae TaxID=1349421 RepID=A0A0C1L3I4_9BACT|nr:carboxypeptidase-like regulatory domain-containing protein [Flavihumibacter solisilvae]KIC94542.1 TonB-dependent receptor [Flavihumibacter solisilvae]